MDNLNYQHQLGLIAAQTQANQSMEPSFLKTLGQNFAGSLGTGLGMGGSSYINSQAFGSKQSPGGGMGGGNSAYAGAKV